MLGKKKTVSPAPTKPAEPQKYDTLATMHGNYLTTVPDSYKNRKAWHRPDPRQMFSFIPGTITTIDVAVGSVVKKGDKLLTFKAMKMDNTYLSPIDGQVAKIEVEVGQIVPKGGLLLTFE
ncbi:MAG: acetyl-CoA carboxylase biotin carboxyl carrier protein subunit [Mucinivorans sp.]